jgi:hypothetical protein
LILAIEIIMARISYELGSISRQSRIGDQTPSVQQPTDDSLLAEISTGLHESSLPPVDGGKDAWFFLAACFALEALTWGTMNQLSGFANQSKMEMKMMLTT